MLVKNGTAFIGGHFTRADVRVENGKIAQIGDLQPREGEDVTRKYLACDLLILDDLGTEMITPMSLSALYTLVNTRLVNGRKMIISTNCSEEELAKKYTPQICSRIAGEFIALPFVGQDIRKLKRGI